MFTANLNRQVLARVIILTQDEVLVD